MSDKQIIKEAIEYAKKLGDLPPNIAIPEMLANEVKSLAKRFSSIKAKVITQNQLEKAGAGLLLGVGKGSEFDAYLGIAQYIGNPSDKNTTLLVGKGLTFDTGGLNIKIKSMEAMKFDKLGAANCLATMQALAALKTKTNVTMIIPCVENAVGSKAIRPSDILTAMDGKKIEIMNTDAEGRLALADAITFGIKQFNPKRIITVATLTGAIGVALSDKYSGLFCDNPKLCKQLLNAGKRAKDPAWHMPIFALKNMKSRVADLINCDLSGHGGGSCSAAFFLQQFTQKLPFAHLDVAFSSRGFGDKGPTGRPVKLLISFFTNE